jgi:hypothetical protein
MATDFPVIEESQAEALFHRNVGMGENDRQIAATYSDADVELLNSGDLGWAAERVGAKLLRADETNYRGGDA